MVRFPKSLQGGLYDSITQNHINGTKKYLMESPSHKQQLDGDTPDLLNMKQKYCASYKSIFFLKIQKTGSTTVFNMLHRYALHHNLRATVYRWRPQEGKHEFVKNLIPTFIPGKSTKYNLIADHSTYDRSHIEKVLQAPIVYITLLRHPLRQLTSYLEYTPLMEEMHLKKGNSAAMYLTLLDKFEKNPNTTTLQRLQRYKRGHLNWQATVLGFNTVEKRTIGSLEYIEHFKDVEKNMAVGISDYFDESLVYFRRRLCLTFTDILYVKLRKSVQVRPINTMLYRSSCRRNNIDCLLYDHFNVTLWKSIELEGPNFSEEVIHFKKVIGKVSGYCNKVIRQIKNNKNVMRETLTSYKKYFSEPASKWNAPFNLTALDCALMRVDEIQFSNHFYFRQNQNACDNITHPLVQRCPIPWTGNNCSEYCNGGTDDRSRLLTLLSNGKNYLWS